MLLLSAAHAGTASLGPEQLGVIVNTADPLSVAIGAYYSAKRRIPKSNILRVSFESQRDEIPAREFDPIKRKVERQAGPNIQAYALTWARPYKVGCMSITSAFAFGTSAASCPSSCGPTARNPYFDSATHSPFTDLHIRPAMAIAAQDLPGARALIDRGVLSDGSLPAGTAYLVTTDDALRNVRSTEYVLADRVAGHEFNFRVVTGASSGPHADVMFYFTGAAKVSAIDQNHFLPGAVADHLTSFGGMLTDSPQMSSLRWLAAGATGSYGTVVEPCNLLGKFPSVPLFLARYLAGETLIEAYWKSLLMPSQGIFIGEPLAAPFRPH